MYSVRDTSAHHQNGLPVVMSFHRPYGEEVVDKKTGQSKRKITAQDVIPLLKFTRGVGEDVRKASKSTYANLAKLGLEINTSFYEDMAQYKTGVPTRAILACFNIIHNWPVCLADNDLAMKAFRALFPKEESWETISAVKFEERINQLNQKELLTACLNELGYYTTWIQSIEQDARSYIKIVSRMVPPTVREISTTPLFKKSYTFCSNWNNFLSLHESTYYQKAFFSPGGFYELFAMFARLMFRVLCINSSNICDCNGLKRTFKAFHLDVRVPFSGMARLTNFLDEKILYASMRYIYDIQESVGTKCFNCASSKTISFFHERCIMTRDENDGVNTCCNGHCHWPEEIPVCSSLDCHMKFMGRSVGAGNVEEFRDGLEKCGFNKQKHQEVWMKARVEIQLATVLVSLARYQDNYYRAASGTESSPKKKQDAGFVLESWQQPLKEKIRFCWNCFQVRKLYLCSSCKRARYCGKKCSNAHWESHKKFCIIRNILMSAKQPQELNTTSQLHSVLD